MTGLLFLIFSLNSFSSDEIISLDAPQFIKRRREASSDQIRRKEVYIYSDKNEWKTKIQKMVQEKLIDTKQNIKQKFNYYEVKEEISFLKLVFLLFRDLDKSKSLKGLNPEIRSDKEILNIGVQIKYIPPLYLPVWPPDGKPYLIKKGDTLSLLAMRLYGTIHRQGELEEKNRVLIKDPDIIYENFTIYY